MIGLGFNSQILKPPQSLDRHRVLSKVDNIRSWLCRFEFILLSRTRTGNIQIYMEIENQNPHPNQNENLNIVHIQIQMHAQQRRRRTMLVFLTLFSLLYLIANLDSFVHPNQGRSDRATEDPHPSAEESDQQSFLSELLNQNFQGEWYYSLDSSKGADADIDNITGKAKAYFFQTEEVIKLSVTLYKGWFLEDYHIDIVYTLNQSNLSKKEQSKLIFTDIPTQRSQGDVFHGMDVDKCKTMNLTITFDGITNITEDTVYKNEKIEIQSVSEEDAGCAKFQYTAKFSPTSASFEAKALIYSLLMSLICFVQIISCLKILRDLMLQNRSHEHYSLFGFVFMMICDAYLSVFHFYLAIQNDFFITPAFLKLILFGFLELKIAMYIWKERYANNAASFRRELYKFYFKFYALSIVLILLLYNFIYYNSFLVLVSLFLLPQIVHIAKSGQYVDFDHLLVFGLIATRLFLPLYCRGCPENVIEAKPSYVTCLAIVGLFLIQLYIYNLQCVYGPRYILPTFLRPKTHQYFVDSADGECAVCMTNLTLPPSETPSENKIVTKIISLQQDKTMFTPCGHYFHVVCLMKWMQVKMNCPTCRQNLPPIV